jgi:peptide/nickel transport system substrate-binding protein
LAFLASVRASHQGRTLPGDEAPKVLYTKCMEQGRPGWQAVGSVVIVGLLAVSALQLHGVESRLVAQSQQLRVLGESTERMAAELGRMKSAGPALGSSSAPETHSLSEVRHPEVKNFLGTRDKHWPPPGAKTSGGIAVDWSSGDPKGFNWMLENAGDLSDKLFSYVQSSPAQRNGWTDPDTFTADLAWRVEVTEDFKVFTIYLRKDVKWHPVGGINLADPRYAWLNKEHLLTAQDFVFTFDMMQDPQVQNGFLKSYYQELASWKALDDYTLELRWNKKQNPNVELSLLTSPLPKFIYAYAEDGTPFPESTIGLNLNQHWYNNKGVVGTGPYRLVKYTPGVEIVLARNENYFDEQPALASIRYPVYSDRTQTVLKLKSGELTFGTLRQGQYREEVQQFEGLPEAQRPKNNPFLNGEIGCDLVEEPRYYYVGWNADNPIFADKRVRRAMTLSLNRKEIVQKVFSGLGEVARGPFLEGTPYLAPDIQPLPFDLKQASKLLAEAGWADTDGDGLLDRAVPGNKRSPFEFTLLIYGSSPEFSSAANIFKEDLLSIGVKVNIEAAEWSLMQKRMEEKKFDAFTGAWSLPWTPDLYQVWHSSQADVPKGSNRVGFRNKRADKLIEQLRASVDKPERTRLLREFHHILQDEQPYSFLFLPRFAYCHRRGLEGIGYAKVRPVANVLPWWNSRSDS